MKRRIRSTPLEKPQQTQHQPHLGFEPTTDPIPQSRLQQRGDPTGVSLSQDKRSGKEALVSNLEPAPTEIQVQSHGQRKTKIMK